MGDGNDDNDSGGVDEGSMNEGSDDETELEWT